MFLVKTLTQSPQGVPQAEKKHFLDKDCGGNHKKKKKKKNYSTQYSRVVPHHSTDCAITSLTSEIRRDPVLSSVYGRS